MTKVVYNACYGGFGLSEEAIKLYAELAGIEIYPVKDRWITFWFTEEPDGRSAEEMFNQGVKDFSVENIERHDPILIQVVETLGDAASDSCARLRIAEISGRQYRISEYDGSESVIEPEDQCWVVV